MAKVLAVNSSQEKGVPKKSIQAGYFEVDYGLVGDAHANNWHRQVSLLGSESIDKVKLKLPDIEMGRFAENITTEGVVLYELPIGTLLQIGEVTMEVTQIGKECHHGCEIKKKIGDCVMPREGIFAKVMTPGWVKPGDTLSVISK